MCVQGLIDALPPVFVSTKYIRAIGSLACVCVCARLYVNWYADPIRLQLLRIYFKRVIWINLDEQ